jgi:hypothetical protein
MWIIRSFSLLDNVISLWIKNCVQIAKYEFGFIDICSWKIGLDFMGGTGLRGVGQN